MKVSRLSCIVQQREKRSNTERESAANELLAAFYVRCGAEERPLPCMGNEV